MAKDQRKTISSEKNLQAFALFTMASEHYRKCREFEAALFQLLEYSEEDSGGSYYMGCLSDEIYDDNGNFARGLRHENIVVAKSARRQRS